MLACAHDKPGKQGRAPATITNIPPGSKAGRRSGLAHSPWCRSRRWAAPEALSTGTPSGGVGRWHARMHPVGRAGGAWRTRLEAPPFRPASRPVNHQPTGHGPTLCQPRSISANARRQARGRGRLEPAGLSGGGNAWRTVAVRAAGMLGGVGEAPGAARWDDSPETSRKPGGLATGRPLSAGAGRKPRSLPLRRLCETAKGLYEPRRSLHVR